MIIPAMVDIYVSLVKAGRRVVDSLPAEYQDQVRERLGINEQPS